MVQQLSEIMTPVPDCLGPTDTVADAARMMRDDNIGDVPVVEDGRPAGVVSIGDLAIERDPASALADISAAPANA